MSNYVDDNLDLPNVPKVDGAGGATGTFAAADHTAIRQALNDIKDFLRRTIKSSLINASGGTANPGAPVYAVSAGSYDLAKADGVAPAKAVCIGLVGASTANGVAGDVQHVGVQTLTTAQWDAVTGQTGGLTAGATYYVSAATAGLLTTTPPTANPAFDAPIGVAISTTQMLRYAVPPIGL